ncbi:HEAT repeat domain-containing protein [candidate division KSB1 bacterium]
MKKKTFYPAIISCFTLLTVLFHYYCYAELAPRAYSFSSLLPRSDLVVCGTVEETEPLGSQEVARVRITEILYGSATDESIFVAFAGFGVPDEPNLFVNGEFVLFLSRNGDYYSVVNNEAGTSNIRERDDIVSVIELYTSTQDLFTPAHKTELKELFSVVSSNAVKSRLLWDLEPVLTAEDETFLSNLIQSDVKEHRYFALTLTGRLQIFSLRETIEGIANSQGDPALTFHAIAALGDMKDRNSITTVKSYITSPDDGIRRAAIEAAGKIGDITVLPQLRSGYATEDDFGMRMSIITAVSRLRSSGAATVDTSVLDCLNYFRSRESNQLVVRKLDRTISSLENIR